MQYKDKVMLNLFFLADKQFCTKTWNFRKHLFPCSALFFDWQPKRLQRSLAKHLCHLVVQTIKSNIKAENIHFQQVSVTEKVFVFDFWALQHCFIGCAITFLFVDNNRAIYTYCWCCDDSEGGAGIKKKQYTDDRRNQINVQRGKVNIFSLRRTRAIKYRIYFVEVAQRV